MRKRRPIDKCVISTRRSLIEHLSSPQGMHEILGIIVYSLHMESVQVNDDPQSNPLMRNLFDPQYLEHDA